MRADRVGALDGLRGLVIMSVVLNHAGGYTWARGAAYDTPIVDGILGSGAVAIFFVVGGFIVAEGLLREQANGRFDPWRFYLRRVVRLGGQLVAMCIAVAVALQFATPTPSGDRVLRNVLHVLTYTFNSLAANDILTVETSFTGLWYLGVQQQCYLLLPLLFAFLGRWRVGLVVALIAMSAAVYLHRQELLGEKNFLAAGTLTTSRSDGLLIGVAFAAALPWLSRWKGWRHVLWVSGSLLIVLKLAMPTLDGSEYYDLAGWSVPFTIIAGLLVTSVWLLPEPTRVSRFLEWGPLRRMGKASLAIFIWHYPILVVMSQHTSTWSWPERAAVSLAVLTVVVVASERWIDEPIRRLLSTRPLFRIPREDRA